MEESESRDIRSWDRLYQKTEGRKKTMGKKLSGNQKSRACDRLFEKCFSRIEDQKRWKQEEKEKNTHTRVWFIPLSNYSCLKMSLTWFEEPKNSTIAKVAWKFSLFVEVFSWTLLFLLFFSSSLSPIRAFLLLLLWLLPFLLSFFCFEEQKKIEFRTEKTHI